MESQIIGIKELHVQLKQVSEATRRGQSFLVVRNSKPVFKIEPLKQRTANKKYSLADFEKLRDKINIKNKNLSKNIDKILYA